MFYDQKGFQFFERHHGSSRNYCLSVPVLDELILFRRFVLNKDFSIQPYSNGKMNFCIIKRIFIAVVDVTPGWKKNGFHEQESSY